MSLFGTSPTDESPPVKTSNRGRSHSSLFDDDADSARPSSSALFQDDDDSGGSPWDMPTPRKQQTRADVLRNLLPASDVPDTYHDLFDTILREDAGGRGGRVTAGGVAKALAAARLRADDQARIMSIVAPDGVEGDFALGRDELNVLLALVGLAQEGETVSLDGVDERRRRETKIGSHSDFIIGLGAQAPNLPQPKLPGLVENTPFLPNVSELAAKPPQRPVTPPQSARPASPQPHQSAPRVTMDYPEDPWNTPDVHKHHNHPPDPHPSNVTDAPAGPAVNGNNLHGAVSEQGLPTRTTSNITTGTVGSSTGSARRATGSVSGSSTGGWGYYGNNAAGFNAPPSNDLGTSPFAGGDDRHPGGRPAAANSSRTIGSGRTGSAIEENIVVTLMPEKEGMFLFQHHNYEVLSTRRGSKVIRRYSDFVWLLDCLHKRYPFRALPLLPPKRVAVNGNHFSNDGAFIEKRRRGLARFLNAVIRHPVLGQEQLVVMFVTVPTELAVWRKQATISVQDEFDGRPLPPGLEDSLSPALNDMFERTRSGIRRSAEIYISVCNIMDRLVKRYVGVSADHARIAMSLTALTEVSADTYATDTNDVPLLNDGLQAMSKHLRSGQTLMEDEARAWDEGVLEDLKRQRDALVSVRDLFDRRDRLDRDNIPSLERRIQSNETKLANLRAKPDGMVKPGEIEKVVEAIIKDKESIVNQHNRSVFVKECLRDELIYFQSSQYHVTRWNQDWSQERVKYSELLADNWRSLVDELEGMPTGD